MTKLYDKHPILFSLAWIAIYVIGGGIFEEVSRIINVESLAPAIFFAVLSVVAFLWVTKNKLSKNFGLCKPTADAKRFVWFVPLAIITISNIGLGVTLKYSIAETVFFIVKMLCVGFLEELIFRGFLFKAMCRDNVKVAIIVSSVTFGFGHIVNLFNGSGMELWENAIQIVAAVAFGFMYVVIFYRGGSVIPCILSHGIYKRSESGFLCIDRPDCCHGRGRFF